MEFCVGNVPSSVLAWLFLKSNLDNLKPWKLMRFLGGKLIPFLVGKFMGFLERNLLAFLEAKSLWFLEGKVISFLEDKLKVLLDIEFILVASGRVVVLAVCASELVGDILILVVRVAVEVSKDVTVSTTVYVWPIRPPMLIGTRVVVGMLMVEMSTEVYRVVVQRLEVGSIFSSICVWSNCGVSKEGLRSGMGGNC